MHRIDGPGATPDNKFTEGNPVAGIPATTVTADFLNAVQEEICGVIEGAGLDLDKPNNAQLLAAVRAIAAAAGFATGDVKLTLATEAPPGWVMCDDGTIGPPLSGATSYAGDDAEALYTLLWENVSDTYAPVTGGRGASAAADWAAGKPIALTRMLGRSLAVAGNGAGLSGRVLGQYLGAETHTLTVAEMPQHSHAASTASAGNHGHSGTTASAGGHTHGMEYYAETSATGDTGGWDPVGGGGSSSNMNWKTVPTGTTKGATRITSAGAHTHNFSTNTTGAHTHAVTVDSAGGGTAHNNMQPTTFLNAMIRL